MLIIAPFGGRISMELRHLATFRTLATTLNFTQTAALLPISDESVHRALKRLKTNWKRAKHWITSPDPQYLRKKYARDNLIAWA
jgi:hypothetical protein